VLSVTEDEKQQSWTEESAQIGIKRDNARIRREEVVRIESRAERKREIKDE
jgi:hypothetical protein